MFYGKTQCEHCCSDVCSGRGKRNPYFDGVKNKCASFVDEMIAKIRDGLNKNKETDEQSLSGGMW